MSSSVRNISDSEFKNEVLSAELPVLIDFWAPWCPPCKALAPILDEVAEEYQGKLTILKMNVDENPVTPSTYSIQGLPTLLLFSEGEVFEKLIGLRPKDALVEVIEKVIAS